MAEAASAAFFSYSRDDSEFALRLAEDLKAAGANVWLDQLDIEAGMPWDRAVENAVTTCPRMLVILSPTSVNSDNVRDEISFALDKQKRVIPVLYRECDVPFRLARLQHIDFRTDYARGLKALLRTLGIEQQAVAGGRAAVSSGPAVVDVEQGNRAAERARLEKEQKQAAEKERQEEQRRQVAQQTSLEKERKQAAEQAERAKQERKQTEHPAQRKELDGGPQETLPASKPKRSPGVFRILRSPLGAAALLLVVALGSWLAFRNRSPASQKPDTGIVAGEQGTPKPAEIATNEHSKSAASGATNANPRTVAGEQRNASKSSTPNRSAGIVQEHSKTVAGGSANANFGPVPTERRNPDASGTPNRSSGSPPAVLPPRASGYHVIRTVPVGGESGWDYVYVDSASRHVFVSHGTHVAVLDADTYAVVGDIPDTQGVHGIAVASALGRGFTSNGRSNDVTIFDLKTFKPIGNVKTDANPDAIAYEPVTKRVFTFNGRGKNATAINAADGTVVGTIPLGGKPEFATADGQGTIFVNDEDTSELHHLDAQGLKELHKWPLAPCKSPSGLAMDTKNRRLFSVCDEKVMAVVNADTGQVVATPAICDGPDAAGFDPATGYVFASCGDGNLTVIHEDTPDKYTVVENVPTKRSARTMGLDLKTHNIFLPAADFDPPAPGERRGKMKANSFVIVVVAK